MFPAQPYESTSEIQLDHPRFGERETGNVRRGQEIPRGYHQFFHFPYGTHLRHRRNLQQTREPVERARLVSLHIEAELGACLECLD